MKTTLAYGDLTPDFAKVIRLQLFGIGQDKKPNERFDEFLQSLLALPPVEGVDVMIELLIQVNAVRNPFYLKKIFHEASVFIAENGFYLVDGVNSSLDYFMHQGDVKESLRILKLIIPNGDSRTLEILRRYSTVYRDRSVVSRLTGFRNKLERKLVHIAKKMENLEMKPILDPYQEWQGDVHA